MKLLDSSLWLAHLVEAHPESSRLIETDILLFSSILTLFDVRKKLTKAGYSQEKIDLSIDFIKKRSMIIPLDEEIITRAVDVAIKNNLGMVDAIIYSSALQVHAQLVTADNDFRKLPYVEIITK